MGFRAAAPNAKRAGRSRGNVQVHDGVEAFNFQQLRRNVTTRLTNIYVNRLVELFAAPFARDGSQMGRPPCCTEIICFPRTRINPAWRLRTIWIPLISRGFAAERTIA